MIITKIQGGLGNQMFQYAVARHLAIKNNTELKMDISFFNNVGDNTYRKYRLDNFNIEENFLSEKELKKIKRNNFHGQSLMQRILRKIFIKLENRKPLIKKTYITELSPAFEKKILEIRTKKNIYLYGNWQSEKYFKNIKDTIIKDFSLKKEMTEKTKYFLSKIKKSESVSIHIRRGDYVKNTKTKEYHGICSLDYYKKAIKLTEERIKNPVFFVFSDDIEWVKNNLKTKNPLTFVSGNNMPDYEEMVLMSKCNHNIIANSSFSWWGAWLNSDPNKIVIAPKKWYNAPVEIKDLIPNKWITI
jgi:hypothetical protein